MSRGPEKAETILPPFSRQLAPAECRVHAVPDVRIPEPSDDEIVQLARVLRAHGFEAPPTAEAALKEANRLGFDISKIERAYIIRGRFEKAPKLSNSERRLLLEFDTLAEEMRELHGGQ